METDMVACLVLTTWPADRPAAPFARALVDARLAACVHVASAGASTYRWKAAVEQAAEQQIVIKTLRRCLAALEAEVRRLHPYELPEWLVIEASGSRGYVGWIAESVATPADQPSA